MCLEKRSSYALSRVPFVMEGYRRESLIIRYQMPFANKAAAPFFLPKSPELKPRMRSGHFIFRDQARRSHIYPSSGPIHNSIFDPPLPSHVHGGRGFHRDRSLTSLAFQSCYRDTRAGELVFRNEKWAQVK